jgi:hypothetical protein
MIKETYSITMALFDFVPVLGFFVGAIFLAKLFFHLKKKHYGWMMLLGGVLVFSGGALQASWKLMMSLDIANLFWMSQGQFVFMSFGYLMLLIPTLSLIKTRKRKDLASLGAMAAWKIPFLMMMTLASLGTYGILAYISIRRRLIVAAAGFIFAFLGVILLGGMASQLQTIGLQWIEQSVNSLANLGFALGSFLLFRDFAHEE